MSELKQECDLGFIEQCKIVWEGARKGVNYDGCTASPDLNFGGDCCGAHDAHYQLGGISRAEADRQLRECIQKKGYILLPWLYWLGVRIFARRTWNRYRKQDDLRRTASGNQVAEQQV